MTSNWLDRSSPFVLLFCCLISLVHGHFQPSLQQVYQQQPPQQAQHQVPIQNQYQYQQPQQPQYQPQAGVHPGQAAVPQQGLHYQQLPATGNNILHDQARIHDKEHLKEHLGSVLNEPDLNKLSEEELQFYYFKIHDSDNNNKLDGAELIKSLIHWHVEESRQMGANAHPQGTTKIFTDEELAQMIDPILETDDKNKDGFIDYVEFLAAQKARGM